MKVCRTVNGKRTCRSRKSYNPFKMWGAWVGATWGLISGIMAITSENEFYNLMGIFFGEFRIIFPIISALISITTGFLIGWGIHSLVRKYR